MCRYANARWLAPESAVLSYTQTAAIGSASATTPMVRRGAPAALRLKRGRAPEN